MHLTTVSTAFLGLGVALCLAHQHGNLGSPVHPVIASDVDGDLTHDPIPAETRTYWMRRAIASLEEVGGSPCPFAAFGAVIVNHTSTRTVAGDE